MAAPTALAILEAVDFTADATAFGLLKKEPTAGIDTPCCPG